MRPIKCYRDYVAGNDISKSQNWIIERYAMISGGTEASRSENFKVFRALQLFYRRKRISLRYFPSSG